MSYPFTFRQLEIFNSVAKHLSYTRASEELHLSQPAVSMQVKQMESLIDATLTEKIGKKLYLTDIGKVMWEYAIKTIDEKAALVERLEALKGQESGHFCLAVPETANQFMTLVLAQFRKEHPGIKVELKIDHRKGLLTMLKENQTDLVIMGKGPDDMELNQAPFMANPLVAIAPPKHEFIDKKEIYLSDLADVDFVVQDESWGTRIAMERFFDVQDFECNTMMEMPNTEAIKQAVAAGLGYAIVSLHTLQQETALKQIEVLKIKELPIMRTWFVTHHEQKVLTPAMVTFKNYVIDNAKRIWLRKYPELANHLTLQNH